MQSITIYNILDVLDYFLVCFYLINYTFPLDALIFFIGNDFADTAKFYYSL
jgi:hypothetical protein